MSNLLVLTDSSMKTCEGYSSKKPGKLRFTFPTIQSLQNNINSNKMEKAIEKLNTVYSELISAVEISEKIKAEEEARNKMLGTAELEAKLEQEKMIAKMTEVDEVNQRLKRVSIELLKLAGRIGKYKDQYGINVQKGFAQKPPKAISVKKMYTSVYSELMNKIDLYKIAQKDGMEFPQEQKPVPEKKSDGVPNWKKLFDGASIQESAPVVVSRSEEQNEEVEIIQTTLGKLSEEDLDYRRMIGQLGDELETIENYERNPETVPSQLRDGIKERADKLRAILSNLTGIETKEVSEVEYNAVTNTEFQNLIDRVTGYVPAPTKEEHMKVEESLKDYYSDDNVSTKIRELAEKDILYTFNKNMDQVMAAEARHNNQEASLSIDKSNSMIEEIKEKIQERDLTDSINSEQAKEDAIKTLNGYVEMNNKIEQEQASELQNMRRSAFIVARKLAARNTAIDLNERNKIQSASMDEATRLAARNTAIDLNYLYQIASSADIEARKLAALNTAIDLNELYQIAESSYEEARRLAAYNTAVDLTEFDGIIKSSYKEALRLAAYNTAVDLNELNQIADSSRIEALRLAAKNTAIDLNDLNQILESSYIEALRLAGRNTAIEFDEKEKIAKTASQFAVILASENVKQELLQKREELNKELSSIDSSIEAINKKIGEYNNSVALSTKPVEVKKENNIIIPIEELKQSAQQEAKKIVQQGIIKQGAVEQAKQILQGEIKAGALEQAKQIVELEEIRQGAEEEAQRIYQSSKVVEAPVAIPNVVQEPVITPQPVVNVQPVIPSVTSEPVVPKVQQKTQTRAYSILPISNKYGEQTSEPKPIIASIARVDNMQKNGKAIMRETGVLTDEMKEDNISDVNDLNEYLNGIMNQHSSSDDVTTVAEQPGTFSQTEQDTIEKPLVDYDVA